ncbi:hypothetical protein [Citreimonas sp.]
MPDRFDIFQIVDLAVFQLQEKLAKRLRENQNPLKREFSARSTPQGRSTL